MYWFWCLNSRHKAKRTILKPSKSFGLRLIKIANGYMYATSGFRNVIFRTSIWKIKSLHIILYILSKNNNLLSIKKIIKEEYNVIFDENNCVIIWRSDNKVISNKSLDIINGIY